MTLPKLLDAHGPGVEPDGLFLRAQKLVRSPQAHAELKTSCRRA
jgi:hypothetical protein